MGGAAAMKAIFVLTILTLFAVAGCSDGDSLPTTPANPMTGFLTASIDGLNWKAESAEAYRLGQILVVEGLSGSQADGDKLSILLISDDWSLGEHGMGSLGVAAIITQFTGEDANIGTAEEIGSGSIVVTKNNRKELAGRFSFTAKASEDDVPVIVVDGIFDVEIDFGELPPGAITEDAKILAEDGIQSDLYGYNLAIDGGIIAITSVGRGRNVFGEEAVYLVNSYSGEQLHKLISDDKNPNFGTSLAIGDGVVAVGRSNLDRGRVNLYDVQSGRKTRVLQADSYEEYIGFGRFVAIDRGIVAIASYSTNQRRTIFLYEVHSGTLINKITVAGVGDEFGAGGGIALSDGILAVSIKAPDENGQRRTVVAVFDIETGSELFVLKVDDLMVGHTFGRALAISDSKIAITAPCSSDQGAVYVFDLTTGAQLQELAVTGRTDCNFGRSVSFDSGIIVVGASRYEDDPAFHDAGTAFVFDAKSGQLIAQLLTSDGIGESVLGKSVVIEDKRVFASAIGDHENGFLSGAVYGYYLD